MRIKRLSIVLTLTLALLLSFLPGCAGEKAQPTPTPTPSPTTKPSPKPPTTPAVDIPKYLRAIAGSDPGGAVNLAMKGFIIPVQAEYPHIKVRYLAGSTRDSVTKVESGDLDLGLSVPGFFAEGMQGKPPFFTEPLKRATYACTTLLPLSEGFMVLANSDIKTPADLWDKRIGVGMRTSMAWEWAQVALGAYKNPKGEPITFENIEANGGYGFE